MLTIKELAALVGVDLNKLTQRIERDGILLMAPNSVTQTMSTIERLAAERDEWQRQAVVAKAERDLLKMFACDALGVTPKQMEALYKHWKGANKLAALGSKADEGILEKP